MKNKALLLGLALLAGCSYFPLRPGIGMIKSGPEGGAYVRQSQNPQAESTQKYERTTETIPPGLTNATVRITERGETKIGAAQKDTAREVAAKLGSLKSVVWIGILVFLFGAVSFVYPPLKIIVGGSVTTSAVITAAGLALIVLPSLVVGHELLILAVAGAIAGVYFFAHRHGTLKGIVDSFKK